MSAHTSTTTARRSSPERAARRVTMRTSWSSRRGSSTTRIPLPETPYASLTPTVAPSATSRAASAHARSKSSTVRHAQPRACSIPSSSHSPRLYTLLLTALVVAAPGSTERSPVATARSSSADDVPCASRRAPSAASPRRRASSAGESSASSVTVRSGSLDSATCTVGSPTPSASRCARWSGSGSPLSTTWSPGPASRSASSSMRFTRAAVADAPPTDGRPTSPTAHASSTSKLPSSTSGASGAPASARLVRVRNGSRPARAVASGAAASATCSTVMRAPPSRGARSAGPWRRTSPRGRPPP